MTEAADRCGPTTERPVVACYCATFLKPEMWHIYRQITSLRRVTPFVITQKREEAERFPFDRITVVPKPATHFVRCFWQKQILAAPWQISAGEVRALGGILDRANAQLLHVYFGHMAVHLLPLLRASPRPSVVSLHGADVLVGLDQPPYRTATQEMLRTVRLALVRSESLARALLDLGCAKDKIRIQRTGIPLQEFPFRPRVWPIDGAWKFVQICRLIEKKGLPTSLRAFARFAARHPQASFAIAGDGPLRPDLEDDARRLGIASQVVFTGFLAQAELRELFYRSHIFLHPSEMGADGNQEGVPNSMLEAMASGLPVFATFHGGIPEAIENEVSGILVPEKDAESLGQRLLEFTASPDLLSELARHGAERVAERFEQQAQAQTLEDYYFETLGASD